MNFGVPSASGFSDGLWPIFLRPRGIWMHFDTRTIQTETFNASRNQALFQKCRENPLKNPIVRPTAQSCINCVPITIFFGHKSLIKSIFRNI